jgi:hypothetical protein
MPQAKPVHPPSDDGRDELIVKLALQMNVVPTPQIVSTARTLWIDAVDKWKHGKAPKPDVAKCISQAVEVARKAPAPAPAGE